MTKEFKYTEPELLACTASRILENKKSVFVGTGLPMIAAMLAQCPHRSRLSSKES
jgi:glutaconate CoA-transferase, subunit B